MLEGVGVLWTRVVPRGRAGQTRWFDRAWHMRCVDPKFSQNVYLPMKITTQLVELY
jgi:hypothetical protein